MAALAVAGEDRAADAGPLDVLLTAGSATGRLTGISAGGGTLELLTGSVDAFEGARPTARIILSPESERTITDNQIAWVLALMDMGRIQREPRTTLLTNSDSTYPELAGGLSAIVGSLWTMLVTALVAMPIGILAAVYLEEFAPKNRVTEFIEVNINNLAAVPSIVFGLLGAALYLNFLGMPRSAPVVGGLVLALMTFPVVIIAARAALKAVPPSVRSGALAVGASQMQTVFHHVLPLAAPGIFTGAILGMARALGETAPLLLIGMVAFVGDVPKGPMDESTVMPVLIFSWSNNAERAWEPLTSAMIVILLVFLLLMNGLVVFLRRRYERRW
jgi:phosphate transport system permease protein